MGRSGPDDRMKATGAGWGALGPAVARCGGAFWGIRHLTDGEGCHVESRHHGALARDCDWKRAKRLEVRPDASGRLHSGVPRRRVAPAPRTPWCFRHSPVRCKAKAPASNGALDYFHGEASQQFLQTAQDGQIQGFFAEFSLSEMRKILRPDPIGTQDDTP